MHLVGAAAEVVVQRHVLGVQLVVDVRAGRVGRVDARVQLPIAAAAAATSG